MDKDITKILPSVTKKDCVMKSGEDRVTKSSSSQLFSGVGHRKDNESCKFSILIAIVDPPGHYGLDHHLFCGVFVAKVKN